MTQLAIYTVSGSMCVIHRGNAVVRLESFIDISRHGMWTLCRQ